jgi:diguanylate cyclase (GGDEF)-like protein
MKWWPLRLAKKIYMAFITVLRQRWANQNKLSLDGLLFGFSTYALPILIGIASVIALLLWQPHYGKSDGRAVPIRALEESGFPLSPAQALASLQEKASTNYHDTRLSEAPVWFTFSIEKHPLSESMVAELPSRHAITAACWDASSLTPLGKSNKTSSEGRVSGVKAGFAVELGQPKAAVKLLCRSTFVGPARLSVMQMSASQLVNEGEEFHRNSGLLEGGLIVLALFVLVTAIINRDRKYLLFAGWLIVNLRVGSLSAGWDAQWLGHSVPEAWLFQGRSVTLAIYYVLTLALFKTIFAEDLERVGHKALVKAAQWTCIPLLVLSIALPYAQFLPILWITTGFGISMLVFFLIRIILKTRSQVAMWYGASLAITLFASLYEVLSAALGYKGMIGAVNSVTAALASSLLASLAIAAQMRQEHKQRLAAQAELQHTFDAMPVGLFTLDLRGRFTSANPALMAMLGSSVLEQGKDTWQRHFSGGAWTQLHHLVHTEADGELELKGKSALVGGDEPHRFLVRATLARGKIEGSLQDVTEKSKATEGLLFLANNDPLTKVFNRRGIEIALDNAMVQIADGKPVALAYLDLDRFKLINDLYGHNTGDTVLKEVCERVKGMIAGSVQFGRVGGDEFVLVFSDTTVAAAAQVCRGIVESIGNSPYVVGELAFHVRGSIGLIEMSSGMKIKDAVSTADRACREAKIGNCEGLVVYEKHAKAFQQHEAELKLVEVLASKTATQGLFLVMQPIMSLSAPHESLNFEVLLRMKDKEGVLVPTDRLIKAGENSGRMSVIDRWVLSTTLDWLNQNYSVMKHTKFVCMNLSGASLNDEKFMQDVYGMLEKNKHIVEHLCLEITESVALHDLENTKRFVEKVRGYGAKVALDDFGAGYTSFSYLKELTADLLKIDGSFIVDMNRHPANVAIVEAIVSLAKNLGMKTIAEWAEDAATVQTLVDIGVDYVQGYVVARPQMPANMLTAASSASFIEDDELAMYVSMIGKSQADRSQASLFVQSNIQSLH